MADRAVLNGNSCAAQDADITATATGIIGNAALDDAVFYRQAATDLMDITAGLGSRAADDLTVFENGSTHIVDVTAIGGALAADDLSTQDLNGTVGADTGHAAAGLQISAVIGDGRAV